MRDAVTTLPGELETLRHALEDAVGNQRRADCMARVQSDAVQLALELLVREPDIDGFFRVFIKSLVEECESIACSVWLLADDDKTCDFWMAYADGRFYSAAGKDTAEHCEFTAEKSRRDSFAGHLLSAAEGWTSILEYVGDDERLPSVMREFNRHRGVDSIIVAPMALPTRTLGWMVLGSAMGDACETSWRRAVVEAIARQGTLALHHSRVAEQSRVEARRQAVLEERNRIARDIHDTLTQGFAAILMQLQAAQRQGGVLPAPVSSALETAVDLARTHIIEARRSVGALRPQTAGEEDVASGLRRITDLTQRTTDIPIELTLDELPALGEGVPREIVGIAQEALTNAVRHAKARRIRVHAGSVRALGFRLSVADDGRGILKEHRGDGFGMTSMQERAERIGASLTIVTAPRAGTEIVLAWEPPSFSIPARTDAR
jgi:signal transduction histidine kinase